MKAHTFLCILPSVIAHPLLRHSARSAGLVHLPRAAFTLSNGQAAQKLNAQFDQLTKTSQCNEGDQACVSNGFAQCVGGKFEVQSCGGGLQCFALPLVNKKGTSVTCDTKEDAEARIAATGATGGLKGDGASAGPTSSTSTNATDAGAPSSTSGNGASPASAGADSGSPSNSGNTTSSDTGTGATGDDSGTDSTGSDGSGSTSGHDTDTGADASSASDGSVSSDTGGASSTKPDGANDGDSSGMSAGSNSETDNSSDGSGDTAPPSGKCSPNKSRGDAARHLMAVRGRSDSADFKLENAKQAQAQNAKFANLTAESACKNGEQACIGGAVAECVGGQFKTTPCSVPATTCAALPLVDKPGTAIACANAIASMKEAGAAASMTG